MNPSAIQPAFRDPARQSQAVFRTVMEAMARPGRILPLAGGFSPPAPLSATAAAILLTLADFETAVWLDRILSREPAVTAFLRFHTGARLVDGPDAAAFALIADIASAPPLTTFAQGASDYPDQSTTVIFQVEILSREGWVFAGPGIDGEIGFGVLPVPANFTAQLADNRSRFPQGVDMIFAGRNVIAALPRSARLVETR